MKTNEMCNFFCDKMFFKIEFFKNIIFDKKKWLLIIFNQRSFFTCDLNVTLIQFFIFKLINKLKNKFKI